MFFQLILNCYICNCNIKEKEFMDFLVWVRKSRGALWIVVKSSFLFENSLIFAIVLYFEYLFGRNKGATITFYFLKLVPIPKVSLALDIHEHPQRIRSKG